MEHENKNIENNFLSVSTNDLCPLPIFKASLVGSSTTLQLLLFTKQQHFTRYITSH
jgi:hypothetical protein